MPTRVRTGARFAVVRTPQRYGTAALEHLRKRNVRRGAVIADGPHWTFCVPPGSDCVPWPSCATYLSDSEVTVPPRNARDTRLSLHWASREPAGHLLTHPIVLSSLLSALASEQRQEAVQCLSRNQ
ncbi:hypothetical protein [Streptomyces olivaceoviridis]|uniref:hypothetical protein n=1 Tax=Streptomyces olivaceoviridis TaxID=1921 RepID=UPI003316FB0F